MWAVNSKDRRQRSIVRGSILMSIQAGNLRALEAVTHVRQFAAEMAEQLNLAASVEPPALNLNPPKFR